ncbi:helix-turn-helix transcriptional regulator [Streptomyces erythrochromogenes]|uniref:helix-turn-helix transcriptional regulator n=1 Tax=Streptomyces erythrochromogenes TaxID=285574 RepID=UPI002253235F|nr:AraC family transcriptional regulator [Streptomyces erythrochromogenes]MCX5582930.1 AraC family transcriptional regulator [Streptomyces erythrochromogenes]
MTLEPGCLTFIGGVGTTGLHSHAAVQLMVVADGQVELKDRHGQRLAVRAALIPTRAVHAVHGPGATAVFIYCDPDAVLGRALQNCFAGARQDCLATWIAAARPACEAAQMSSQHRVAQEALRALAGEPYLVGVGHPAVRRAIDRMQCLLGGPVRLQDLAEAVDLSPSRLGHLFAEELGLSFPVYVRWARLRRAMELARGGATLTQAAHRAGFADSSHLTRVFHEMFGLAPSEVLRFIRWNT